MFNVVTEEGPKIPTILISLHKDGVSLLQVILIPHSIEMYELHLSSVDSSLKGRMKDVCIEGLKFIFSNMEKIEKLIVNIPVHNKLAIRLAKQCFSYEGTLKNSFKYNDVMEDQEIYGICRREVECL